ncbi:hypothetical protein [Haladaptatus caseinilyticus]|uniref:hypothetical protein n=1 Tax=Haladaptatus caseinilyticus TaxID=2993314 RepID=UPI00224B78EC|nr:hypothetical protein [Haladaptatus caseinilyticus]
MSDELSPNDLTEGMTVEFEWAPKGPGSGGTVEGEITRVWRPEESVREFTVREDDETDWNVYTEYRTPPVERVEVGDGDESDGEPETETVGRLKRIVSTRR